ncbi:MAG: BrnT family toxin [Deltaproteobacteria bacterium]|nr:BrnT family toxin [Deltaproteobacteria bacterium]
MKKARFEWDEDKDRENQAKHNVSFSLAQRAFLDPCRVIVEDLTHSGEEDRFYCIGRVNDGIMTVRFTSRGNVIRILGAGYWRKGRKIYEEQNKIHRRTNG